MTNLPDDEIVSAVLDGEATDEEVARVDADAALTARLGELRAARDAIAAPVSLPSPADRDAAVAAAMTESVSAKVRPVVDMRDRRRRRALRVASIAAALLIVVGIASAIAALSSRDDHKAKSAAGTEASVAPKDAVAQPAAGGPAAGDAAASAPQSAAPELGSFQTPEDVVDAVRRTQQTTATTTTPAPTSPPLSERSNAQTAKTSDAGGSCLLSRPDAIFVGRAHLSGQPVIVIVFGSPGQQTVELLDSNCAVVFSSLL